MQVVVLMGGLGTRLGLKNTPKAMADVMGKPFFDWQLTLLKRWGFYDYLFLIGHEGDKIEAYYGNGEKFGVNITYSREGESLKGTGGALKQAYDLLNDEFLLIYGDSFMDIDYRRLVYDYFLRKNENIFGVMTIFHNKDMFDKSNVVLKDNDRIIYNKRIKSPDAEYIDYGVSILSKKILQNPTPEIFDIGDLMSEFSIRGELIGHRVYRRFYEIGSPLSLKEFAKYVRTRFFMKNKALFFDRDGVINKIVFNEETEQLDSPFSFSEIQFIDGAISGLKNFYERGFLLFIVTNQPGAAKGKVKLKRLYELNDTINEHLKKEGVEIEFINMCPHHEVGSEHTSEKFLIKDCNCRKPKPGLITELLSVYNIDMDKTYMIGDSYTDVIAAKKAGIKSIMFGGLKCDACHKLADYPPDFIVEDWRSLLNLKEFL